MKTQDKDPKRIDELMARLTAPFSPEHVRFKPVVVSGNRAMAIAYLDARSIQDRLDEVLGVLNWQDEYEFLSDGSVVCRLRLRIGEEWITKMDVGGQSEQPDEGDRRKAAVSDALKRAAVKFGVGRYLYRLPTLWVDYDPKKKQFVRQPTLSPAALPKDFQTASSPPKEKEPEKNPPTPPAPAAPRPAAHGLPRNGEELQKRLYSHDERLSSEGVCQKGELIKHLVQAGEKKGYDGDLSSWNSEEAIRLAVEETKAFESAKRKKPLPPRQKVA